MVDEMKKNGKTTALGVLALITAVASALTGYLSDGSIPDLSAITLAIMGLLGLTAADGK